jgi:glucose-1-phosphatase
MLPHMMVPVHFKQADNGGYGPLDENYLPLFYDQGPKEGIVFDTVAFQEEARRELVQLMKAPSYDFLEDVLQYSHSLRAKTKGSKHFDSFVDVQRYFHDKASGDRLEPVMIGDLKVANRASDALILMYYEAPNYLKANFNREFSFDDMCRLASIKDQYDAILFSAPIIAVNISHCMLENVYSEMKCNWHRFCFLCSHDSMIHALLSALRVEDYKLENTIEEKTPIGVKFLLEKWVNPTTCKQYIKARLLYQSTEQIQEMQLLDLDNPPMSCELSFTGLKKEGNGMYRYDDFMNHIEKTLDAYKRTAVGKHPWE